MFKVGQKVECILSARCDGVIPPWFIDKGNIYTVKAVDNDPGWGVQVIKLEEPIASVWARADSFKACSEVE